MRFNSSLCPLLHLTHAIQFALRAGEENEAVALREEGMELIGTVKEKIEDSELREKFLQTSDVQVFMD